MSSEVVVCLQIDEARELYDQGSKAVGGDNAFIWQVLGSHAQGLSRHRPLFFPSPYGKLSDGCLLR